MNNFIPLNIYGIGIRHPRDWQVFINPNNKFTFDEGLIKIDKVTVSKKSAASLSIRWANMKEDINIDDYVDELEKQFQNKEKRSRRKDRYKIIEKIKCTVDNRNAYLLKNEFVANHSIYRILGKEELVKVLQVLFYSEQTGRMVVASLSTTPEELAESEHTFIEMLTSLYEDAYVANENEDLQSYKKIAL
ncbi:hypothetical protein KFZ56_16215 [Virgibacillus sp. NKC19-3]|uniref:hypothetical protein n=1 Tax=Virgibacillus saliphilus TaxID=2831674 RepID=UPI001C9B3C26|nr:hypothetical protein [Virgibacillus sp. NKC19-3]MBY7144567.1 hypothetical protein [Virgibacillus sp. NKC19-3]